MSASKDVLIIGGTRNLGHFLSQRLLNAGHRVTLLNRGLSGDDLPDQVARLRCDRTNVQQMRRALAGRQFDAVVDNVLYKPEEAETIVDLLDGQVGHYIFASTGQVYLVREGVGRPYREDDYFGATIAAPPPNTYDYEEWLYGMDKRAAENILIRAHETSGFPYTTLRLPMVNSERDGFKRLYSYTLRIKDGGPIVVPEHPDYPLRHVYSGDVVNAIMHLIQTGDGKGRAYNISQDETVSLETFLGILGDILDRKPIVRHIDRDILERGGFLPDCSPFSDAWMSELDNSLSKRELGLSYTPLEMYLRKIVSAYEYNPPRPPVGYGRRQVEKKLVS